MPSDQVILVGARTSETRSLKVRPGLALGTRLTVPPSTISPSMLRSDPFQRA